MAQTEYNLYIANGYAGAVLDMNPTERVSATVTGSTIDMGVGVTRSGEGLITLGAANVGAFFGITIRDLGIEATNAGDIVYPLNSTAAVLRTGYIRVALGAAGAVVAGAGVFMNPTTGSFAASGAAGHTVDLSTVASFESAGAVAGDIVSIRLA